MRLLRENYRRTWEELNRLRFELEVRAEVVNHLRRELRTAQEQWSRVLTESYWARAAARREARMRRERDFYRASFLSPPYPPSPQPGEEEEEEEGPVEE